MPRSKSMSVPTTSNVRTLKCCSAIAKSPGVVMPQLRQTQPRMCVERSRFAAGDAVLRPQVGTRASVRHREFESSRSSSARAMNDPLLRQETDFPGFRNISASVYWGVHTERARETFPIFGQPLSCMPDLVRALAFVEKAAAQANAGLGVLDPERAQLIAAACDDVIARGLHDQFVVDVIQGGAGTSIDMNANEVIE